MANRHRRATPSSEEGRFIASRIQDARRHGATNKQIADAFGINERTVRKIIAGETPGTRTFHKRTETHGIRQSPNVFRADVVIGYDEEGFPETRSVNVLIPDVRNRFGQLVAPTAFDALRFPDLYRVAEAEAESMLRRYGPAIAQPTEPKLTGLRPIVQRSPKTILHTIRGTIRA